ncbi:LOW QUALITY PROTEIN: proteoglycan Cow [Melitaea cinxia]|uniref:LOW QUALITY PROTEIN: proteoglycan Cow n=1 Tax=Melitaea cinxia TaxID=113334 RepID=UPI001E272275|nr:LOW QUALITY PROTEIN: proteoglycan Cow [Melitaea cinxia]
MRASVWAPVAAALLTLAAASPRRLDQDFEFDDTPEAPLTHARRPRRYVYDPENPMCRTLVCKKREVCLLRDAFTALCANKKDILRRGDVIVAGTVSTWDRGDDEDVFYETRTSDHTSAHSSPDRCVGCGGAARGAFLCGSDNRTYSSLCRLDLHNCVHRAAPPVRLACRGFCPCAPRARPPARPARTARAPQRYRPPPPPTRRAVTLCTDIVVSLQDRRRRRLESQNEVLPERSFRRQSQDGEGCALDKMANRLLDWFSVLMDEAGGIPPPQKGFPHDCKAEVRWMFSHLDTAGDGILSPADLYALRHDERERCLRPFLSSCGAGAGAGAGADAGAGAGAGLTRGAWCACLRRAARPCAALARAHPAPPPGAYVPACDARGFYRPRQCHAALGVCWCVDAHGVERAGSRTKGAPLCPGENETDSSDEAESEAAGEGEGEGAGEGRAGGAADGGPDDDEDAGGSGDREPELRF